MEKTFPSSTTIETKTPVSVMTDEISFYVNSLAI
jgi:hypothetical protein